MKNIKNLKVELAGQVGENAVWDGPLSKEGFPMGKGSSYRLSVDTEHLLLHVLKLLNNEFSICIKIFR
jgi:hypothetical protein